MRKFHYRRLMIVCVTLLAILTVAAPDLQYVAAQQAGNPDGVVQLTGKVTVTSRFVLADTTERFMAGDSSFGRPTIVRCSQPDLAMMASYSPLTIQLARSPKSGQS